LAESGVTGNSAIAGMRSACACSATRNSSSMPRRSTPGIDAMAARPGNSCTNTGRIRSSAVSTVSRISRREKSSWRMRRGRVMGWRMASIEWSGAPMIRGAAALALVHGRAR